MVEIIKYEGVLMLKSDAIKRGWKDPKKKSEKAVIKDKSEKLSKDNK